MKRCGFFALSFALLLTVLFTGSSASASTPWDGVIDPVDSLILKTSPGMGKECTNDVTLNWSTAITSNPSLDNSFRNALDTGDWAVAYSDNGADASLDVYWSETKNLELNFVTDGTNHWTEIHTSDQSATMQHAVVLGFNQSQWPTLTCDPEAHDYGLISAGAFAGSGNRKVFLFTGAVNYPVEYEGIEVPGTGGGSSAEKQIAEPQYSWNLSKDENGNGILQVKYLGNISPFLTGVSHLVVEKMTENWGALDETLGTLTQNPAGWADWNFNIGPGPGWYMFRIDHNQQLDSPPWPENASQETQIGQVFYQFYWDGSTALSGTTVGCEPGTVCNEFTSTGAKQSSWLSSLNIDSYGLASVVTAPLAFFQNLPSAAVNCTPLSIPFPMGNVELPCMTPLYTEKFGSFYSIWQTVLIGAFSYVMGLKLFNNIKQISNPKNDSIEVVKL